MAGIISTQRDSVAVQDDSAELSPAAVRGQMQIPPDQQDTYQRIVMAGKKLLYSEQLAPQIQELLKGPGSVGQKLGQGVLALLALLMDKAGGALPPQLLIPAGVELVAEAGAFLREAGVKVSKDDIAEGTAELVESLLEKAGVSIDQLPGLLKGGAEPDGDENGTAPPDGDGDEQEAETPEEDAAEGGVEEPGEQMQGKTKKVR